MQEGTWRKVEKKVDCVGRIRGRTVVPKRSIGGVDFREFRKLGLGG